MTWHDLGRLIPLGYGAYWWVQFHRHARRIRILNGDRVMGLPAAARLPLVTSVEWLAHGIFIMWLGLWIFDHPWDIWISRVGIVVITLPLFIRSHAFWSRAPEFDEEPDG